ncbi:uncharacterized protein LOC109838583 [Asparagus officinalis]|uniref:uncharacterized protein LOC109838583 n=1 Tax=Asparagus officinalis TaxID=4686 RepID=UPI00098E02B2|nr:uncharacterized protein LOC109838583 [Asparagus officinalis]
MASALKILWNIHINKENLWIKWIHGTYLKHNDVWHVQARKGDSWMWRQILKVRDKAQGLYRGTDNLKQLIFSCSKNSNIRLSALSSVLSPTTNLVPWHSIVWEKLNYPKHSFVSWLAVQDRLLTQDKLINRGIVNNNNCSLCTDTENRNHLFFECCFSRDVWIMVMEWLQFKWKSCNWDQILSWYSVRFRGNGFKQKIKKIALTSTVYSIWCERNARIFKQKRRTAAQLFRDIKINIMSIILNDHFPDEIREWICSL